MAYSEQQFNAARVNLSGLVLEQAAQICKARGLSFIAASEAPASYEEVRAEFENALNTGAPVRVYAGASDSTIYTAPAVNHAFRFWHDYLHFINELDFSEQGELCTAAHQCRQAGVRFGMGSLEWLMLQIDTAGQVGYYQASGGQFVVNQLAFCRARLGMAADTTNGYLIN